MSVCFCIDNSTLSRNISNGSRNNPADVHRTSRTSLQFHYNNRHNVPHPTPKHTDKVNTAPHTTTQELKTPSAQRSTSNTEAYRQKSTTQHTQQRRTPSVPNGVGARGRAFGLRNSEIAFPRTYRIENATGVAPSSEESYYKKQHNKQQ